MRILFVFVGMLIALAFASCERTVNDCNGSCGKIYVANEGNETITVIDASTYEVLKFIHVDSGEDMMMVHNIQASGNGQWIWATYNYMESAESGFLVIDPVTDEIQSKVVFGADWNVAHVVFDSLSQFGYIIAADSNMVVEVNTSSLQITRRIYLGAGRSPHGLRYSRGKLYVANVEGHSMSVIDVASGGATEIATGGMAIQAAVLPGQYAFVSLYDTKSIFRLSIQSGDTISFALPAEAMGPIQIYPGGSRLLICDQGMLLDRPSSDKLYFMEMATGEITGVVTVGDGSHGIVTDPYGRHAFCTNRLDRSVSVVDMQELKVLCTIPVGVDPNGITFWTSTGGQP